MGKAGTRRTSCRFAGAVDADGHILEPPDLWETYLDPSFRDRALRIVRTRTGSRSWRSAAGGR